MPKFTSKLGTTFYLKKGRKSNKLPIIGCHGGPGGTHHSISSLLELAVDRQVIVYDQIGSGQSTDIPKAKWKIETFCKNLKELMEHLEYKKTILYGASWGGTLILEFYKRYPSKVGGLIFHSSLISEKIWRKDAEKLISKLPPKTKEIIKLCEKIGATDSKVYKLAMKEYYSRHVCRVKVDPKSIKKRRFNEGIYEYMWGPSEFCSTGTLKDYNGIPILKNINVPTIFMSGEFDEATPKSSLFFSKKVKGGVFKIIKGASHSSFREKKLQTLKLLNDWLLF